MVVRLPRSGLGFVAPALAVMGALILFPIVYTVAASFLDDSGAPVGWRNYIRIVNARVTNIAFWNTIYYVGLSVVLQVVLGTAVGILLNQNFRGRAFVRSAVLIPWVIPGIVAATTWAWMFHSEFGIVNYLAQIWGLSERPIGWLTEANIVLPALVAVNVWKMFPFVAVMVLAGLQAVPDTLYEAARVDGARFRDEVRYIMLPQLKPILVAIALLLMIWGLNGITIIYAMTKGGPANRSMTTPIQIYTHAFELFRLGEAAALSVMFFLVVLALIALYIRTFSRQEAA
jgi:multiple sugar transport system permease protein